MLIVNRSFVSVAAVMTVAGSALGAATAFRGTHIGFDTATGTAGEQLQLRTGYGTSGAPESEQWAYRFASVSGQTQLQTRSARYATDPNAPFEQASYNLRHAAPTNYRAAEGGGVSPVAGWYANSSMAADPVTERQTFNATGADSFISLGRLNGGSFAWEIISVTALNGSSPASFAIGMVTNPAGNTNNALRQFRGVNTVSSVNYDVFGVYDANQAGGGSLADRSITLGYGNHFHGWGFFISQRGEYEIKMRVYDLNGVYTASDSFSFLVNSIPSPSGLAMLGLGGLVASRRRRG
jgi:hypothetical protein